jgi:lysozyme family protein
MPFEEALEHTLSIGVEGGYANDPDDSGGETYKGVSRRSNRQWPGWAIVDEARDITSGARKKIMSRTGQWRLIDQYIETNHKAVMDKYLHDFYLVAHWAPLEGLPDRLRMKVFDFGVNAGLPRAIKTLQRVIGARIDGIIGPQTLALATDGKMDALCARQAEFYRSIAKGAKAKYLPAWLKRAAWRP